MVNLTIDGLAIRAPKGTTIMEAAAQNNIAIPKLCFLKEINEIAACRVCVVELEGKERLITACNNVVEEGMVIYTNRPRSAVTGATSCSSSSPSTTANVPPVSATATARCRTLPAI